VSERGRAIRRAAVALLLVLAAACGGARSPAPETDVVATLDGHPLRLAELVDYLDANLLDHGDGVWPDDDALRVKSRLFDAFLEERLLLAEAERQGIAVSDPEVEAYMAIGDEQVVTSASGWAQARRRLLLEKLEERLVETLPPLDDEEVLQELQRRRRESEPGRVRLRALLIEDAEEADRVYRDIRRGAVTFDEAIVSHGSAPGQGLPLEVDWENLWEEQQQALENLKPGQVSRPVVINGQSYLFQLQARLHAESIIDREELEQARRELQRRRGQRALAALLEELRKKTEIRIYFDRLPFRYVPEELAQDSELE